MASSLFFLDVFERAAPDLVLVFGPAAAPAGGIEYEALDIMSRGFIYGQIASGYFNGQEDETLLLHAGPKLPRRILWVGLGEPMKYWLEWADRCAERLHAWAGGLRLPHLTLLPPDFANAEQADYRGWGKKWEPHLRALEWLERLTVAADNELVEAFRR